MNRIIFRSKIQGLIILMLIVWGCVSKSDNENNGKQANQEELQIRNLHKDYVECWKEMNEEKVMNLLEDNAMIQPNRLTPITGKEKIREFWFPKDSSRTSIIKFETEVISLNFRDTIAIMMHESYIDWNYEKDTTKFGMIQKGINTTIYRRQEDMKWKIWRSMWTDIFAKSK